MTTTENHDEPSKSPHFFQGNNTIKKKKKLVSSHARSQELNQGTFYQIFLTLVPTRKIFTTKTLYLIPMHSQLKI